jgi:transposase
MLIIGCDFHAGFQQVSIFDNQTGEVIEKKLLHPKQATEFYCSLPRPVRVGIEAGSPCQWFRRLLAECGHELWVGDAARIRAAEVRSQKTDRRDAALILKLMLEERFPRIWIPTEQERDVRQLLMDRHHRMRLRTRTKNQLQSLALNQGLQKGRKLWSEAGQEQLRALPMMEYAARRRDQLLRTLAELDAQIGELDRIVGREAAGREAARRLMTHPGVGPQTALAMVLTIGEVSRFATAKQVASYLGLTPREHSSGGKQRLGHISKQGSALMRFLLVEAGQTAVRGDEQLRRAYGRLAAKKSRALAKVMVARRLAVRLYWMLRNEWTYTELARHAGEPESSRGQK